MSSINVKRSAATLGVLLAGLLAAAGPAGAQFLPTGTGVKAPGQCANGFVNGCAPGFAPVRQVGSADHQMKAKAVVVLIGANDYGWTAGNGTPCCRDD